MPVTVDQYGRMPHRQCAYCHTFTYGPHNQENPGRKINRVDPERGFMTGPEMDAAGMGVDDQNVSHGSCKRCNKAGLNFRKREGRWGDFEEVRRESEGLAGIVPTTSDEGDPDLA